MIEVETPDGIAEFPDGTPREAIQGALRRRFGRQDQPSGDLPLPPTPPTPNTFGNAVRHGATDPIQGGAQLLVNSLPQGAVDAVNDATAWVNRQPVIGAATRALGMVPATREDINRQTVEREDAYQARRGAAGQSGLDVPRVLGNLAGTTPAAMAFPAPASLLGSVGLGGASGAALALLQPVDREGANYWDDKTQQAAMGGAVGGVAGPAAYALGRLISPHVSPQVRTLADEGVGMTPGQMLGGLPQRVENAATSIPGIGDAIRGGQRAAIGDLNVAAANRVLQPLGESLPRGTEPGRALAQQLQQRVSQAYDDVIPQVRPFGPDQQFAQDLQQVGSQFLTPDSRNAFARFLSDRIVSRFQGGPVDGATYQTIKSELGRTATQYATSSSAAEREIGQALFGVQRAMQDLLGRTNPQVQPQLAAADAAYSALQRFNDATSRVAAVDGVFSPQQLQAAVRGQDPSMRHRAFARGDALMQDLSDAARSVLPSNVPDSGTPLRAMTAGAMAGASGMALPAAAAMAGTQALYSDPSRRLIAQILTSPRSQLARQFGDLLAVSGGALSAPVAAALLAGNSPPSVTPSRP